MSGHEYPCVKHYERIPCIHALFAKRIPVDIARNPGAPSSRLSWKASWIALIQEPRHAGYPGKRVGSLDSGIPLFRLFQKAK